MLPSALALALFPSIFQRKKAHRCLCKSSVPLILYVLATMRASLSPARLSSRQENRLQEAHRRSRKLIRGGARNLRWHFPLCAKNGLCAIRNLPAVIVERPERGAPLTVCILHLGIVPICGQDSLEASGQLDGLSQCLAKKKRGEIMSKKQTRDWHVSAKEAGRTFSLFCLSIHPYIHTSVCLSV